MYPLLEAQTEVRIRITSLVIDIVPEEAMIIMKIKLMKIEIIYKMKSIILVEVV